MKLEIPLPGLLNCRDCVKFGEPPTCENELLELMKTGYSHTKPKQMVNDSRGNPKDMYEVMVGATVDLYCGDYWKKPKKDSWDDNSTDGILTALCQPNMKFQLPYDISSWGSCLAKCPAVKPVPPTTLVPDKQLVIDTKYMLEKADLELWEGEDLVYMCYNETLVINNNPDMKSIKYKCKNTGLYNVPVIVDEWPVCTKKPIRPEIKEAIRLMTMKFDKNIEYRNALYGGVGREQAGGTPEWQIRLFSISMPAFLGMVVTIMLLCCCTRPDSIICKICEVQVKEKPGGGSATRRSARSARSGKSQLAVWTKRQI